MGKPEGGRRSDDRGPEAEGTVEWSGGGGETPSSRAAPSRRSLTLDEFERALAGAGLVDPSELGPFVARLASGPGGSAEALGQALVRAGKLTRFQASAILQDKAKVLTIGDYVIIDRLGRGGMGMVFKARHRDFVDPLALKVLPPSASKSDNAVQRFRREAKLLARLEHPNLVTSYDIGEYNGVHFLVMDFVEGRDLAKIVRSKGPMDPSRAIEILVQAARGLAAAHERGIVHRDIKPANLMLDTKGVVRVLDLGLARMTRVGDRLNVADESPSRRGKSSPAVDSSLTQAGTVMGTVEYVSPEQSRDSSQVDHRADIYSLGCTLHYLLTGKPPFSGRSALQRMMAHQVDAIPSLRDARRNLPPDLDAVFRKMLAKRPEGRQRSMAEVIEELERCRKVRSKGRVLLFFDDEAKARAVGPAATVPTGEVDSGSSEPEGPSSGDDDLSGYELLPPALSGLWSPRGSITGPTTPAESPDPPRPAPNVLRVFLVLIGAVVLAAALAAIVRPHRSPGDPPPPPPPEGHP